MKVVKSLLLGTAAGLVAIAGAQAADLPVKAKPVQYVKICSLYGAGFYYIPGTDTCLKIGGWVRQYIMWNANGSLTNGPLVQNTQTRGTIDWGTRTRGYITADARNQTEYGTVRSYIAVGLSAGGAGTATDTAAGAGPGFSANRAFVQFAGFTFGLSQSFFDFYSAPATSFWGGAANPSEDSGDGGKVVTAYTAQFGNGWSASLSLEGQRNIGVINTNLTGTTTVSSLSLFSNAAFGPIASSQEGAKWPDLVANLRIDQSWGSAQIMGVIHDASGNYYGPTQTTDTGNPSNAIGWAVGGGAKFLTPSIGAGDYFQFEVNYSQGASGYVNNGSVFYNKWNGGNGGTMGFGLMSDSVYGGSIANGTATDIQLTTSWGVNAAYEHHWSPHWQTSIYGGYIETSYNSSANNMLCYLENGGTGVNPGSTATPITGGCNNNWSQWNVGSRTQWNIDAQTYIGLDVMYQTFKTATFGSTINAGFGQQPGNTKTSDAIRTLSDQSAWMAEFRVHRNFYP